MNKLFAQIDVFRTNVTEGISEDILNKKEKELGINLPEGMRDFYMKFGNDKEVMGSNWKFYSIENVRIQNDALVFGCKPEDTATIGIMMQHLLSPYQAISYYSMSGKKWFSDGFAFPEPFFFHIACWQLVNSMASVAKTIISWEDLQELANGKLSFFSNEKKYIKGNRIVSVYGDGILGSYFKEDGELYLGTRNGDEVLEELEEELGLDLDWL